MVEAPGIEPGSDKRSPQPSTCVAQTLVSRAGRLGARLPEHYSAIIADYCRRRKPSITRFDLRRSYKVVRSSTTLGTWPLVLSGQCVIIVRIYCGSGLFTRSRDSTCRSRLAEYRRIHFAPKKNGKISSVARRSPSNIFAFQITIYNITNCARTSSPEGNKKYTPWRTRTSGPLIKSQLLYRLS